MAAKAKHIVTHNVYYVKRDVCVRRLESGSAPLQLIPTAPVSNLAEVESISPNLTSKRLPL